MHSTERKHFETNTPDSGASGIRKPRLMRAFLSGTVIGVLVVTFGQATATRTPVPVSKHSPARRIFASVDAAKRQAIQSYSESPLSFEPNQGQTGARVQFLSRGPGYAMLLTPDEAVLRLRRRTDPPGASTAGHLDIRPQASPQDHETLFRMKFVGANPNAKTVSFEELPGKAN